MANLAFCIKNSLLPTSSKGGGGFGCISSSSFGGGWEEARAGNSNWQTSFKTSNAIIKLYPNPAANNFTIETQLATTDTPLTLNLYGLDGVLVLTKQINTNTAVISTETLNAGIYVCTVMQNGNVLQREKLVITK